MLEKFTKFLPKLMTVLLVSTLILSFTGCKKYEDKRELNTPSSPYVYDKYGNTYPVPTDNDETGWFSVEILNQYAVTGLTLPPGTEVVNKPEPNTLYLQGNKDTLANVADYVYSELTISASEIYEPVITLSEDQTANVTSLNPNFDYDKLALYPDSDDTSITFVYTVNRNIYQCSISLESPAESQELVCVSFSDKTTEYEDLI